MDVVGYALAKNIALNDFVIEMKSNRPTWRFGYQACFDGNRYIFLIGGISNGSLVGTTEMYDTDLDVWTTKASMPTARAAFAIIYKDGKIFAIGGSGPISVNEMYDIASNTWSTKASMPTYRDSCQGVAIGNIIYVVGGAGYYNSYILYDKNEAYDISANTWTTKANMLSPRVGMGVCTDGSIIYVIGGYKDRNSRTGVASNPVNTIEVYNPSTDSWQTLNSTPIPFVGSSAFWDSGKILLIGGFSDYNTNNVSNYLEKVYIYDVSTKTWKSTNDRYYPAGVMAIYKKPNFYIFDDRKYTLMLNFAKVQLYKKLLAWFAIKD